MEQRYRLLYFKIGQGEWLAGDGKVGEPMGGGSLLHAGGSSDGSTFGCDLKNSVQQDHAILRATRRN